jgi:hypothetical protein
MLVRGESMHEIVYNKNKKALIATISGNIGIDQANRMLMDFKNSVNGLNANEHILIINPENISASLFVLPIIQNFIQIVAKLKFKKIYLINSDKYADIIKQSLNNYGVIDSLEYASSVAESLSKR